MNANQIRDHVKMLAAAERELPEHTPYIEVAKVGALWEIAAQLAELNERSEKMSARISQIDSSIKQNQG